VLQLSQAIDDAVHHDVTAVARGLAVFPIPGERRVPGPGWQEACTADLDRAAALIVAGHNLGVGCRASDVVGVDLDRHGRVDGVARLEALCDQFGQRWPGCPAVRSRRYVRRSQAVASSTPSNDSGRAIRWPWSARSGNVPDRRAAAVTADSRL
jgi:Bifunctional DNA primase/polymerase, N-terminal